MEIPAGKIEPGKLSPLQSTDFYRQIPAISSPWKIANVDLDMDAKRVVIRAEVERKTKWYHPDTKLLACLHKWQERTWRHLCTCQQETCDSCRDHARRGAHPLPRPPA